MPAGITQAKGRKGRFGIARRSIGHAYPAGADLQQPYTFPASLSPYSFTPPVSGKWKFVGWGPGASTGGFGGASGGYVEVTRQLTTNQAVAIVAGFVGTDTTITLPDGTVATAGKGASSGGTATGGDVNLNGSAGGNAVAGSPGLGTGGGAGGAAPNNLGGGAGAPANLPYRGGEGASDAGAGSDRGGSVGSGGCGVSTGLSSGGPGLVLAVLLSS